MYLVLVPCVRRTRIDHHFMDLSELSEVLLFSKHFGIRQPWRKTHDKYEVLLDHADVGQMLPVLGDLLLLGLIFLALLRLDLGHFFPGQGLEIGRVLRISRTASWAIPIALCSNLVPTEPTYLEGGYIN